MITRKAQPEDLPRIQQLNAELFAFEQARDPDLKMDWPQKEGQAYFSERINGKGVCFVAEVEGEVIGYLAGNMEESPLEWRPLKRAEGENMFIRESFRGQGTGQALMDDFLAWAREHGAQKVFTSVYSDNEGSLRFHEHLGFKPYCVELETDLDS